MRNEKISGEIRGDIVFVGLGALLFGCCFISLVSGRYSVSAEQVFRILLSYVSSVEPTWTDAMRSVVTVIRLPRVISAALVGAALALSGGAYQGVFRNPLVSPGLLGVSAGAGVGASIAILLHLPGWAIQTAAFLGGISASLMALALPRLMRNRGILMLVLSGVVVSGFMGALQGILTYVADADSELPSIVHWLMGSLASAKWEGVRSTLPVMIPAFVLMLALRWRVNILSLDEVEARTLGVDAAKLRGVVIACSTLLTASAVCLSGTIGWVGLIVPHLSRLLLGEDNRRVLPACVLLGASFVVVVDTVARNLTSSEIPLSILTGLIGAPLFVAILVRKRVTVG